MIAAHRTPLPDPLRVGIYADAYNVYYGARGSCGRGRPGWRWIDVAGLSMSLINPYFWPGAQLERLVYCTAFRERDGDATSLRDQLTYIDALRAHTPELEVIEGKYVRRTKSGVLVDRTGPGRRAPKRLPSPGPERLPDWLPVEEVTGAEGHPELLATVATHEEKGSDVNVASSLLIDVFTGRVDAAIVLSNDSDLHYPLACARQHVPVATINPGTNPTARDLQDDPQTGVGRHWWRRLRPDDYYQHQLPNPVGEINKPDGW